MSLECVIQDDGRSLLDKVGLVNHVGFELHDGRGVDGLFEHS